MSIEIDINDRTPKTPCQTPGCPHPNYHVCLVGKVDLFPQLLAELYERMKKRSPMARYGPRSEAHKQAIAESQQRRWQKIWDEHKERDDAIIERYKKGDVGMKPIAAEFDMTYAAVRAVLRRAAKQGRVTLNPKGVMPPNHEKIA